MDKYVVCIFSHMDGNNRTFIVEGTNQAEAAKKALIAHCSPEYLNEDYENWVNSLGEDFESVASGAVESELVLSEPFRIEALSTLSKINKS